MIPTFIVVLVSLRVDTVSVHTQAMATTLPTIPRFSIENRHAGKTQTDETEFVSRSRKDNEYELGPLGFQSDHDENHSKV